MTLLTDFPAGVVKVIPIVLHQWVERIIGPVLVILAFALMTAEPNCARLLRGHGRHHFRRRAADGVPFYDRSQMTKPKL
jgi:hypothetical protein